jgi:hypothetical protein
MKRSTASSLIFAALCGLAASGQVGEPVRTVTDAGDSRRTRSDHRSAERKAAAEAKRARKQAARAARGEG